MPFIRLHEATDINDTDEISNPQLKRYYATLVWRKENCDMPYPEIDFTEEEWLENWRELWYKQFPDLQWYDLPFSGDVTTPRKKRKNAPGAGNPGHKLSIEGVTYNNSVEAGKAVGLQDQTVRVRCKSKSERFKDWFYL